MTKKRKPAPAPGHDRGTAASLGARQAWTAWHGYSVDADAAPLALAMQRLSPEMTAPAREDHVGR